MAFINFLQNHDQVGNRPLGDRLEGNANVAAIEAALAVLLLAPAIPMLFMGEEWGTKTPFPFFCDFAGELANAVRTGRRGEYAWAYAEFGDEVPDALVESTFQSARLDWNERREPPAKRRLTLVRELLAIRQREIVPRLAGAAFGEAKAIDGGLLTAHWRMADGATLSLLANLSDRIIFHASDGSRGTLLWGSELSDSVPPWSVHWRVG
jgi:maltooligosyltrehalose trehalohydrolase